MRVKNNKVTSDVWCGQTIESAQYYDVPANEIHTWRSSDKVLADLTTLDLLIGDGSTYKSTAADAINLLMGVDITPRDSTGRPLHRAAATIEGWHYQLLGTEITTAKFTDGFYSKKEDGTDTGFITYKLYDASDVEITDAANEGNAVKTTVLLRPTHSYDSIGAIFAQAAAPTSNVRMWVTGLPGVANVRFGQGGINLKHAGIGAYQLADGRASKNLQYNAGVPDLNSFRFTLKHDAGVQHTFQIMLEIFKAP